MIGHAAKLYALQDASTPTNPGGCLVKRPGALRDAAGDDWIIIDGPSLESVSARAE
jgi:hypothetical protein